MLTSTLRWRDEFKVDQVIHEEFPDDPFGKLGYVYGEDKHGGPVTCDLSAICIERILIIRSYNLYGASQDLSAVFGDVQRFLRCVCPNMKLVYIYSFLVFASQVARQTDGAKHLQA